MIFRFLSLLFNATKNRQFVVSRVDLKINFVYSTKNILLDSQSILFLKLQFCEFKGVSSSVAHKKVVF